MKAYPKYKDSDVEWLGEVPEHWQITRLKFIGDSFIGIIYSPSEVVESKEEGRLVLRASNIQNGKICFDDCIYVTTDISDIKLVKEGDILICSRSGSRQLIGKNIKITKDVIGATFGAFMTIYRTKYSSFIYFYFNSQIFLGQSSLFLTSTINQLTVSTLNSFQIALPPIEEQKAIATYLDRKTSQIDSLIENKKKLIELLKEERAAIINRAVTKGINPDAEMKDSGIEWLGEVPKHWQVSRLKFTANIVRGGSPRPAGSPLFFNGNHTPWITVAEITKDDNMFLYATSEYLTEEGRKKSRYLDVGILVLSNSGATLGVPKILKIGGCINDGSVAFLDLNDNIEIEFLYFFLYSLTNVYRDFVGQGAGQPNLNTDLVKDTVIGIPPKKEQKAIVTDLQSKLDKIRETVENASKEISLIEEYRTALINEAVTGKIDVREEV